LNASHVLQRRYGYKYTFMYMLVLSLSFWLGRTKMLWRELCTGNDIQGRRIERQISGHRMAFYWTVAI
jgi:hypothetical protein